MKMPKIRVQNRVRGKTGQFVYITDRQTLTLPLLSIHPLS